MSESAEPMGTGETAEGIASSEGVDTVGQDAPVENAEPAPNPMPTIDTNAIAASIRRKLEKEAKAEQEDVMQNMLAVLGIIRTQEQDSQSVLNVTTLMHLMHRK